MPSQFFGLNIAYSGLQNSNAALNTTANNISNVQTEGYSRQQINSQAADALRTFTTYGCAGAGVETLSIERVRDKFYDEKFWSNNSNYGQYEVKSYYMRTLEDYLNDDGHTGFVTVFNNMANALQSITTNSSSTSTKAQFVASADAITDYFNGLYGNLQELQKDINLEIKQCVDQINSISEQIATLNKQINVIELSKGIANDLRDQRDLLFDRLSEFVDIDVTENPIYDTNDPTRETGGTRCVVKIAGGQILVDANDYSELNCVAREDYERINQTDADGLYKICWDNGNEFNLNNASLNGKLKGLVELRDGNNGTNFNGTVASDATPNYQKEADGVTDYVDPVTKQKVVESYDIKVNVTSDYLKSLDECMLPPTGQIQIGNAMYSYDSWTFEVDDNGTPDDLTDDKYSYNFKINPNHSSSDRAIKAGDAVITQEAIKYQGIPYYMLQMNSFIRSFMRAVNNEFEDGTNAYGDIGRNLFTGELVNGDQLTQSELNSTTPADMHSGINGYYWITAGNVCINKDLIADADLLGTRTSPTVGVEECGKVEKVISMLTNKNEYSFRNASANQMLELILSDVAINGSNANTYEKTYEGLKTSIGNQRTSISGVDEDEEAVNLVKFQNAYTLASKMIQTLSEIYDQLILNTGV